MKQSYLSPIIHKPIPNRPFSIRNPNKIYNQNSNSYSSLNFACSRKFHDDIPSNSAFLYKEKAGNNLESLLRFPAFFDENASLRELAIAEREVNNRVQLKAGGCMAESDPETKDNIEKEKSITESVHNNQYERLSSSCPLPSHFFNIPQRPRNPITRDKIFEELFNEDKGKTSNSASEFLNYSLKEE